MNASVAMTPLGSALRAWRDPLASARAADVAAVLIACPVVVHVARRDLALLKQPICLLLLFGLSVTEPFGGTAVERGFTRYRPGQNCWCCRFTLISSHVFDFHEGWMYVLGVGIAGGTLLRQGARDAAPENSAR